jgi:hypothetical protein
MENWKTDQAVTSVTPSKKDGKIEGYNIAIANLEQMPMPVILEVKTASGKTDIIKIPVDVWMRNKTWTVNYDTTEEVVSVVLDPEHVLPDADDSNNSWKK